MNTSAFHEYSKTAKQLKLLIDCGHGDTDDADFLRDKMDPLWQAMTPEEQNQSRLPYLEQCR